MASIKDDQWQDSFPEPREYPRDYPITVHTFTSGVPSVEHYSMNKFLDGKVKLPDADFTFRWFHVPANNMEWVEKCVAKCAPQLSRLDERAWKLKLRPALPGIIPPRHSRQMEPSCIANEDLALNVNTPATAAEPDTSTSLPGPSSQGKLPKDEGLQQPLLTLYLPYMNWDSFGDYCSLRHTYRHRRPVKRQDSPRKKIEGHLARFLNSNLPVHPRRTLDQFYYSSLPNTEGRDKDQTISKWTGTNVEEEGRSEAVEDSLLIMVDQLWCWVLDDKTVLSFFPAHDAQYHGSGFTDLYHSIQKDCSSCKTVWHLYSILVKEATTYLFRQENKKFMDFVEMYRWVTGKKAAHQTSYFQEFQHPESGGPLSPAALDDQRELKLVLEVADIIDELKMIRYLIDKQREVLKALIVALLKLNPSSDNQHKQPLSQTMVYNNYFYEGSIMNIVVENQNHESVIGAAESSKILAQGIAVPARDSIVFIEEALAFLLTEIDDIRNHAEYTHKMLLDLLDLKQKTASLAEARSTTQQGRAIMLFTIITIIFLPLSFFTSYFGQNVSEITGSNQNPTTWDLWRIGTPITVVIIVSALFIAFCIMYPDSRLLFWRSDRRRHQIRDPLPLSNDIVEAIV
ncbi:hypothetical protein F5884DRAFT_473742 [Xylogone sp. PMI_703]|nr:hypothetical protein F5884DRAFT_473742 [Xylogone sp. PMI_703]